MSASRTCDFFRTPARQKQFRNEALTWMDTPFQPHAAIKKVGVDCVNLGREIYRACGLPVSRALPRYAMDGGKHNQLSQLTDWLDADPNFLCVASKSREVPTPASDEIMPGDTLCFRIGRSAHHTGFAITGVVFIHTLFGREVMTGDLRDKTFARILHAVYRPVEVQS